MKVILIDTPPGFSRGKCQSMHNEEKDLPQEKKEMPLQIARFMKMEPKKKGNRKGPPTKGGPQANA